LVSQNIKKDVKINNFSFEQLNNFEVEKAVKNDLFDFVIQIKKL
jgi:hypothetical protein